MEEEKESLKLRNNRKQKTVELFDDFPNFDPEDHRFFTSFSSQYY